MGNEPLIAWLYWNPPKEIFIIPWIDRPIVFYGVFFVAGFLIGYFLLSWMLTQKLLMSKKVSERDIACWPSLIKYLQLTMNQPDDPIYPIIAKLDKKWRQDISYLQIWQEANNSQKSHILQAINLALQQPHGHLSKSTLEEYMPKAFIKSKDFAYLLTDKLTWFVVLGTIIGARLGHVFFYDWPRYQGHLGDILKIWEGGLASHGGVLGVLLGVFLYQRLVLKNFFEINLIGLIDCMVVPSGLVACFIRIGNFFNQEIMGPATTLPWGIIFGDPADGGPIVPRHPTQIYEAIIYFVIFCFLLYLWKTKWQSLKSGAISGLFFILIFSARLFIDFIKTPQSLLIDESYFQMGQYLSIPFILFGFSLLFFGPRIDSRIKIKSI